MKRSFRIIIVLIGLSIGGLFLLQASWLSNLLEITEVQLVNKVNEAGVNVEASHLMVSCICILLNPQVWKIILRRRK
jgi:ABC-type enterochelin transport system permease subunit